MRWCAVFVVGQHRLWGYHIRAVSSAPAFEESHLIWLIRLRRCASSKNSVARSGLPLKMVGWSDTSRSRRSGYLLGNLQPRKHQKHCSTANGSVTAQRQQHSVAAGIHSNGRVDYKKTNQPQTSRKHWEKTLAGRLLITQNMH